jgi:hypothetical protein
MMRKARTDKSTLLLCLESLDKVSTPASRPVLSSRMLMMLGMTVPINGRNSATILVSKDTAGKFTLTVFRKFQESICGCYPDIFVTVFEEIDDIRNSDYD